MARSASKREIGLLLVLVAAIIGYLWYRSSPDASATGASGGAAGKRSGSAEQAAPEILMSLVSQEAEGYDPSGRDLFKFAVRPPTAEELRRAREEQERQRRLAEEEARRRAEEMERLRQAQLAAAAEATRNPPKPQPPPIPLKYIGYLGPKKDRIAVFEDGDQILVAKRGETVKNDYRVVDIKYESVVMGYVRPEFRDSTSELNMAPAPR